jgi:hypothetical protein
MPCIAKKNFRISRKSRSDYNYAGEKQSKKPEKSAETWVYNSKAD